MFVSLWCVDELTLLVGGKIFARLIFARLVYLCVWGNFFLLIIPSVVFSFTLSFCGVHVQHIAVLSWFFFCSALLKWNTHSQLSTNWIDYLIFFQHFVLLLHAIFVVVLLWNWLKIRFQKRIVFQGNRSQNYSPRE